MRVDQRGNIKVTGPASNPAAIRVTGSGIGESREPDDSLNSVLWKKSGRKRVKILLGAVILLGSTTWQATAQQSAAPQLQSRLDEAAVVDGRTSVDATQQRPSTLPVDASGAYHSNQLDKSIEIEIVHGKLSGYVSQLGDTETDSNTPLTFFFDKTSVDGNHLEFQTRVVHGIWFSFYGSVSRGDGEARTDEGYYVLRGVFREHHPASGQDKSADETVEKFTATFKSVRQ